RDAAAGGRRRGGARVRLGTGRRGRAGGRGDEPAERYERQRRVSRGACEDPRETRVGGGARRLAAAGILLAVGVTERLARACARRPRRVIGVWIAAVVAAFVLGFALFPGNLTTNGYVTNNPDSRRAEALFNRFPSDPNAVDEIVDVRNDRLTVDRPAYRRFVEEMLAQARATGVIYRARTWYATHDPSLVSADRHATLVTIQRQHDVDRLLPVVERHDGQYGF